MERGRFPWRIFGRTVVMQTVLVVLALAVAGTTARYFFKRQFLVQVGSQLRGSLTALSHDLPTTLPADWCLRHADSTDVRFTVIARDGTVLCDSGHDVDSMENHSDRPEVRAALEHGYGASERFSRTLRTEMLYGAIASIPAGLVLRGAIPLDHLGRTLRVFDRSLGGLLLAVAALLIMLSLWTARRLVSPVSRILGKTEALLKPDAAHAELADFDHESFGEWADLETSLEAIGTDLRSKIESLVQQREEQAILMSAISDAILAVDADEAPLFYNSRFSLLFKASRLGKQQRLWEIIRDPVVLESFRGALRDGVASPAHVFAMDDDAGRRFFSVSVSPLRKPGGQVYGGVGIFHDVTELKRAEQIRIDFVANVSHELRTPLTAIKGYVDTLTDDVASGRAVESSFLEAIRRNTGRLLDLINDLLDLSSIESADTLQKAALDTSEVTTHVLDHLKGNIEARKQSVEIDIQAKSVNADPKRLEQVLTNLVDNAVKYTPPGGRVRVEWAADDGHGIVLRVSDSGPGIPLEHQSRLFERFYRVDKARSREVGGTGLGLAIVKHIVQRHGGAVWVESAPGNGATFFCRFPA